jgi:glycolate oxidase FAD binding subunit
LKQAPTLPDHDAEAELLETVQTAIGAATPLCIRGGGSKAFYGPPCLAERELDVRGHQGIIAYEPTELAISVRTGTRLATLQDRLQANGQYLPFEPPHFGPDATVGGMGAVGLSGPRRPWAGAVRDAVLGVRIINGQGQALSFGGQVMKNVAGYDLSRLMAGAMGTLGVLLEVSFKVLPRPAGSRTLSFSSDARSAIDRCRRWAGTPLPITATCHHDDRLQIRLEGGERALADALSRLGDDAIDETKDVELWDDLREQRLAFFQDPQPLWRLSLPPATPWLDSLRGDWLVEWGGALRWLSSADAGNDIREAARQAGGHATLFRNPTTSDEPRFTPLQPLPMRYHQRLKQSLDPQGLFNPGRLYPDL